MALIKCGSCGNEVSPDAAACPKCGKPVKKSMGIVKIVLLAMGGLFALCIVGGIVGGKGGSRSGSGSSSSSSSNGAPTPTAHNDQLPWVATVEANCTAYKAAPNDIKKSAIFNDNEALIAKTKVANVKGKLEGMRTDQGGDQLTLKVKVGDVEFHTESLFGPIKKGSAVYTAASEMAVGQCVVFSASSLKASSVVERSKVCDPEYFAVFTALAPCP